MLRYYRFINNTLNLRYSKKKKCKQPLSAILNLLFVGPVQHWAYAHKARMDGSGLLPNFKADLRAKKGGRKRPTNQPIDRHGLCTVRTRMHACIRVVCNSHHDQNSKMTKLSYCAFPHLKLFLPTDTLICAVFMPWV